MRGVSAEADVRAQVRSRHDRHHGVAPTTEGPRHVQSVQAADFLPVAVVKMPAPEIFRRGAFAFVFEPIGPAQLRPVFHFMVAKLPGAAPGRPSPDVTERRKIITVASRWNIARRIEVGPADHPDMSILRITSEQLLTK